MGKPIDNTPCHCLKLHRSAENVITYYNKILSAAGLTIVSKEGLISSVLPLSRRCAETAGPGRPAESLISGRFPMYQLTAAGLEQAMKRLMTAS